MNGGSDGATLVAVIAAGFAGVTALIASASFRHNRRRTSAEILLRFREMYDDPTMHTSLAVLNKKVGKSPDAFPEGSDADAHRRRVSDYFQRAHTLAEEGYLGCRDFEILMRSWGAELMEDPIAPRELQILRGRMDPGESEPTQGQARRDLERFERCLAAIRKAREEPSAWDRFRGWCRRR